MNYSVQIKQSAAKELAGIGGSDRLRTIRAIDGLAQNPFKGSALKGDLRGLRRIRVGGYRVVYEIQNDVLVVLVVRVAHRRDAYRRR